MQDSPQDIKIRLDAAVDPEGNVLDMAAVLEIVTRLERLPITKEALEATRIGKTINLLRKKTSNAGLAKRAKKLVKTWQTLVINHIQTAQNVDSPLNGSHVSSPQVNGAILNLDKSATPTLSEQTERTRILEGKKRGVKRKRDGQSSSDNSPVMFASSSQVSSRSNTPRSSTGSSAPNSNASWHEGLGSCEVSSKLARGSSQESESDNIHSGSPENIGSSTGTKDISKLCKEAESCENHTENEITSNLIVKGAHDTASDIHTSPLRSPNVTACSGEEIAMDKLSVLESDKPKYIDNNSVANNLTDTESFVQSEIVRHCDLTTENAEDINVDSHPNKRQKLHENSSSTCDKSEVINSSKTHDDNLKDVPSGTEVMTVATDPCDGEETTELPETAPTIQVRELTESLQDEIEEPEEPKEHVLDVQAKADGVNGRYSDNGTWYPWTEAMPYNEGSLNILPYVILE